MYVTYKGEIKTKAITRSAAKQYFGVLEPCFESLFFSLCGLVLLDIHRKVNQCFVSFLYRSLLHSVLDVWPFVDMTEIAKSSFQQKEKNLKNIVIHNF